MGKKRVAEETTAEVLKASEERTTLLQKQETKGKKKARVLPHANIYIRASYNNIIINITDDKGNVLAWTTAGMAGFKGPKKATPYAASRVVELVMNKMEKSDIQEASILVRGIGAGRDAAIRALMSKGLNISSIKDITTLQHNVCRPNKTQRVERS